MEKRKYEIAWRAYADGIEDFNSIKIFDDVQWKDYGVRAKKDDEKESFIIPYTSIYQIKVLVEETC